MTHEELVEKVARVISGGADDDIEEWLLYDDSARAAIAVVVEECARVAEGVFPRGLAHTYASENAYIYIAQEKACEKCAAAIRKLGETE